MQLTSLLSIVSAISLISTATAATVPVRRDPRSTHWHVSSFTTGCSPTGCVYSFNIAGLGTANTPSFNTTCSGTDMELSYQPCEFQDISSTVAPLSDGSGGWNVTAQHFWVSEVGEFWAVGQANVTEEAKNFDIKADDQYGVA